VRSRSCGRFAKLGLEFAQEGAGRKDDQRTEAALLGLLLQMVGQFAREAHVLLLLGVHFRLVGRAAEAAVGLLLPHLVVGQFADFAAALRVFEAFENHHGAAAFVPQQPCMGGIGNQDPVGFHDRVLRG
jgi:hypothetical protein